MQLQKCEYKVWYENGQLYSECVQRWENGQLREECVYGKGKIIKLICLNINKFTFFYNKWQLKAD